MLSLCPLWEHQYLSRGELLYTFCTPVFMSVTLVLWLQPRRHSLLDCLALEVREACIPKPRGTVKSEIVLVRLPPSGHCTESRQKHIPSFEKEVYLLLLELQPNGKASVLADI